jgi:hypothetical protein
MGTKRLPSQATRNISCLLLLGSIAHLDLLKQNAILVDGNCHYYSLCELQESIHDNLEEYLQLFIIFTSYIFCFNVYM